MSMESSSGATTSPRTLSPENRFLAALRAEAGDVLRLELDGIQRAFSTAFPHFDGALHRRAKLLEMLEMLAAGGQLRLPANRMRSWQNRPTPALPLSLMLVRQTVENGVRFDYRGFPWVREMAFIAELPMLHTPEDALRLHEFFKGGGGHSSVVPTKERSWQIFGEEKRLDGLQRGQLFEKGRLTLDLLRCRNVTQILPFSRARSPVNAPVLIVENESTFHSFCRINHQVPIYAGVVFGDGNTVLKASDYLRDLARAIESGIFLYFGDLDPRGLQIPCSLSGLMREYNLAVLPAGRLYAELLNAPLPAKRRPQPVDKESLAWLPAELHDEVRDRLAKFGRIAQEALGWEKLCALYQADAHADFSLGFSPRTW